jgi:1-deoxy-D-xylulose-5-phosphate synthase
MVIMAPKDSIELRDMLFTALKQDAGPVAIRYPRGEASGVWEENVFKALPLGKGEIVREGHDAAVLAVGQTVQTALQAAAGLSRKGISVHVVNARFIKPIDKEMVLDTAKRFPFILTVEDNAVTGGFGDAVADVLTEADLLPGVHLVKAGIPDRFIQHGSLAELHTEIGLDQEHIVQKIEQLLYRHQQNKKSLLKAE